MNFFRTLRKLQLKIIAKMPVILIHYCMDRSHQLIDAIYCLSKENFRNIGSTTVK